MSRVTGCVVDAFVGPGAAGNPAAVCLAGEWPPDEHLQAIAAENNLSETAFVVREPQGWRIRWFTPAVEVELCGHATLAAAHVLLTGPERSRNTICFGSRAGPLTAAREDPGRFPGAGRALPAGHSVRSFLVLDFPARPAAACLSAAPVVGAALGAGPVQVLRTDQSYLAVFESERAIRHLTPDLHLVAGLDRPGMIVTAPGGDCDFVSRFFAPREGIPEDPVTGSAHCTLTPYWSRRLGKASLHARQLSARGGKLFCRDEGSRVGIAGEAVTRA